MSNRVTNRFVKRLKPSRTGKEATSVDGSASALVKGPCRQHNESTYPLVVMTRGADNRGCLYAVAVGWRGTGHCLGRAPDQGASGFCLGGGSSGVFAGPRRGARLAVRSALLRACRFARCRSDRSGRCLQWPPPASVRTELEVLPAAAWGRAVRACGLRACRRGAGGYGVGHTGSGCPGQAAGHRQWAKFRRAARHGRPGSGR